MKKILKIPLMKNTFLYEEETRKKLSEFILVAPKLSMDNKCFEFEMEFAKKQLRKDAILFNSGGSANLALLQALKNLGRLKEGDKIAFSSLTWSTNVMPIIQLGFIPVAVDIEPSKLNVMSYHIEKVIVKEKIKAFFTTNVLGFAGDLQNIKSICERYGVIFLEDNCESLGTELINGKTGNFGIASTFSFFVAHHMSTIEGGMVCTDDEELAVALRIVRANGWDRNLNENQKESIRNNYSISSEHEAKYTFYDLGFNFRPTEITGFLGLIQIQYLDKTVEKRIYNFDKFLNAINMNDDILKYDVTDIKKLSSFAFPVVCKTPEIKNKYMKKFVENGIEIRPVIAGNITKQPFYKKYANQEISLHGADLIHTCGFYCGNYPELTDEDLNLILSCLEK